MTENFEENTSFISVENCDSSIDEKKTNLDIDESKSNLVVNTSFTSSDYYDFGTDESKSNFESLNTFNLALKMEEITATVGIGVDTKFNTASFEEKANLPAFEAKLKYDISDIFNAQARFRKIGNTEQYRGTFGGSYKLNNNNSIYSSVHLTTKNSNGEWSTNTGAWFGYTHKFENCSLSAELQQNVPFNRKINSSDTMVNVIFSVPFN